MWRLEIWDVLPNGSIKCSLRSDEGVVCGKTYPVKHTTNAIYHLRTVHHLTEESPEVRAKLARGMRQQTLNLEGPVLSVREQEAVALSDTFLPFNVVESKEFRKAFRPTMLTAESVRNTTLEVAERFRNEAIRKYHGRPVTLALDVGTIYERYVVICLVNKDVGSFVFGGVSDEEFGLGGWEPRMTAVNVERLVSMTCEDLAQRGVPVVATVADNAANMQTEGYRVEGRCHLRCLSHSIQLVAHDFIEQRFTGAVAAANSLRERHREIPAPVVTRWNSTLRMLRHIVRHKLHLELPLRQQVEIDTAIRALLPLQVATDISQADGATLFSSFEALAVLLGDAELLGFVGARADKLISPEMMVLAFFAPMTQRHQLGEGVHNFVSRELDRLRNIAVVAIGEETLTDSIDAEWARFSVGGPPPKPAAQTTPAIVQHFVGMAVRFPRLACVLLSLGTCCPSEACVERAFSLMKNLVGAHRNRLLPQNAMAQLVVASYLRLAPPAPAAEHEVGISRAVEFVVRHMVALETPAVAGRKRTRAATSTCSLCDRPFSAHPTADSVECSGCGGWVGFSCAGIPLHLAGTVRNLPQWFCPVCAAR